MTTLHVAEASGEGLNLGSGLRVLIAVRLESLTYSNSRMGCI